MWWLILIIVACIVVYSFYLRNYKKERFSKEQIELMQGVIEKELKKTKAKKQEIIDNAAKDGKTVPLSAFFEMIEKMKEEHQEDEIYTAETDRQINEFKERFDTGIAVEELFKLVSEYEDEFGML
jgi:hypothetical protein